MFTQTYPSQPPPPPPSAASETPTTLSMKRPHDTATVGGVMDPSDGDGGDQSSKAPAPSSSPPTSWFFQPTRISSISSQSATTATSTSASETETSSSMSPIRLGSVQRQQQRRRSSTTSVTADALLVKGLDGLSLQDVENVTPQDSEVVIASQLNSLSNEEREEVLQDIHGVANLQTETPQSVHESLAEMKEHVDTLLQDYHDNNRTSSSSSNAAAAVQSSSSSYVRHPYELAVDGSTSTTTTPSSSSSKSSSSYFTSQDFWMRFLRAERYDSYQAASRLLRYFEEKLELFGPNLLCQSPDIRIKDLDERSYQHLMAGKFQIVPTKDRAGRSVVVSIRKVYDMEEKKEAQQSDDDPDNKALQRAVWVFLSSVLDDEESQRKGWVMVYYSVGSELASLGTIHKNARIINALPMRLVSLHACVSDPRVKAAASVAALLVGKSNTMRFRCHSGSDMECLYSLMQFGIPANSLPIDMTGSIDVKRHASFWNKRRQLEVEKGATNDPRQAPELENTPSNHTIDMDALMMNDDEEFDLLSLDIDETDVQNMNLVDWKDSESTLPEQQSSNVPHDTTSTPIQPSDGTSSSDPPRTSQSARAAVTSSQPGDNDILLGRGRTIQNHPGNVAYRSIIDSNLSRFQNSTQKGAKSQLVKEVLEQIHRSGGTFWKLDESSTSSNSQRWVPVDEKTALDKVSHSFRNAKQAKQKDEQSRPMDGTGTGCARDQKRRRQSLE